MDESKNSNNKKTRSDSILPSFTSNSLLNCGFFHPQEARPIASGLGMVIGHFCNVQVISEEVRKFKSLPGNFDFILGYKALCKQSYWNVRTLSNGLDNPLGSVSLFSNYGAIYGSSLLIGPLDRIKTKAMKLGRSSTVFFDSKYKIDPATILFTRIEIIHKNFSNDISTTYIANPLFNSFLLYLSQGPCLDIDRIAVNLGFSDRKDFSFELAAKYYQNFLNQVENYNRYVTAVGEMTKLILPTVLSKEVLGYSALTPLGLDFP